MAQDRTNVEYLIDSGALDPDDITEEHKAIVNNDFTREETETLVKMSKLLKKAPHKSSAAF